MAKEKEGVFSHKAVASDAMLSGKPAIGATAVLDRSRQPCPSFDMPDRNANQPPQSGDNGNQEPMSPKERAQQLPRRVWTIIALAIAAWGAVLAAVWLI